MRAPGPPPPGRENDSRRVPRYPFLVGVEVADESGIQIQGQTKDLSIFGCSVDTTNPFPQGTRVKIKIAHAGQNFESFGRVAYAHPNSGMGIVFTSVEPQNDRVLEWWIADLAQGLNSR